MDARCHEHHHPERTQEGGRRESWDRRDSKWDSFVPGMLGGSHDLTTHSGPLYPQLTKEPGKIIFHSIPSPSYTL